MLFNTHTHSCFSPDASLCFLKKIFDIALEKGLSYIAITDHLELGDEKEREFLNIDGYYRDLMLAKDKYLSKGLYIATGIEVGYNKNTQRKIKTLLKQYPFEYVINSVHWFPHYKTDSKQRFFREYIKTVGESVDADFDYDTIGHFGFYTRYGDFDDNSMTLLEFGEEIELVLKKIVNSNKILEINAKGKAFDDVVPSIEMMQLYRSLGGKYTTYASDSHTPDAILNNLSGAIHVAKLAGFEYWTIKKDGQRIKITI
ncbi:MAG: histidinol-phosphatase HisJ family protein [Firmicutes bacterium]|nr:histidinol-phosphatase HisJ family protein [Bacillota bacterium]MCL1954288.1 histidinol-phosphatase HisJ family protein [Bacillota bacterium]